MSDEQMLVRLALPAQSEASLWEWQPDNSMMHTPCYCLLGSPPVPQTMKGQNCVSQYHRKSLAARVRRSWVRLGAMLLALTALGASAATPKRVLILDSFGRDVAPFSVGVSAFRSTLARELGEPVDIYEAPLDMARFATPGFEEPLMDFLEHRFAGSPVDLVVSVGAPAVRFAEQYRYRLFGETPIVYMGVEPRGMPPGALKTNATLVTQKVDLPGMIEDILQLRPDTTNIVVVIGSSPLEKFWGEECLREWQVFTNRVGFSVLENLSLPQIQERVGKLPPHSFIVSAMMIMDADRVPFDGYEGLDAIYAAANAPLFGYCRSHLGRGAVGGRLYQDSQVGMEAARAAIRILRGERAGDIPPVILGASPPTYDWRELTRWGISPNRLPAGSVIEFREPTFWEQHRWRIMGVVAFCCLQTVLIVGLLASRAKRREDQTMATLISELSSRFINLPAEQVDAEIQAAQRRVCEALKLDVSSLWQWRPDNPVMHTLTHYYRPLGGPPVPQTMKGQDYFPWCQSRVLAGEVVRVSSLGDFPPEAARDRETFSFFGLKTTLTIPLSVGGGPVFGSVNFNDMRKERRWSQALVQRLQLVAQIFANALARKVADQTLSESEARLGLAADAAEMGLWSLNLATNRFWLTNKARELFKFTSGEDLTLDLFLSLVHPDDRSPVCETIRTIVQSRGEGQVQYRVVWPDGGMRWMFSRGRVRCCTSGEAECLMGVTVDITERKQAEAALAQTELRYRLLFDAIPESVLLIGTDGRVVAANPASARLYRYESAKELEGFYTPLLIAEKDRARATRTQATVLQGDEQPSRRYTEVRRDGTEFIAEVSSTTIRGSHGEVLGYLGITHDITASVEAEAALRESEERLREAAEAATFGVYRYDLVSGVAYYSPEFLALYGLPADATLELDSDLVPKAVHPADKALFRAAVKSSTDPRGTGILDMEYRVLLPGGQERWVRMHGRTAFDGDDAPDRRPVRANGIIVDITLRKQAEFDAQRIQTEITHLSRVATMGELTASLAHELNQPLTAILANAQAARRLIDSGKPDLEEIRDILGDIAADDQRAGEVIRRVRSLVKKDEPEFQTLDLHKLIEEVMTLVRSDALIKGVYVASALRAGAPRVRGDRIQIQQVLINLIVNSFDAVRSVPGARQVTVSTQAPHEGEVEVSVEDSGPGILPEKMETIFVPFYTSRPDGMGMGLAICRTIITAHGGRIWAENRQEGGAMFRFSLPTGGEEGRGTRGEEG